MIAFYTKNCIEPNGPMAPFATIVYDKADGTHIEAQTAEFTDAFSAATDTCDVKMGPNRFVGDLHTYEIHIETDEITAAVTLVGQVPAWRPETGHFLFDKQSIFEADKRAYFAWLPSVPQGRVEASVTSGGQVAFSPHPDTHRRRNQEAGQRSADLYLHR